MGRKAAKLLEEQGQLGVQAVRDWVSENAVEPCLTEQQINLAICWEAQRGRNLWQSDDRTALICGPREPVGPDPEDMEEGLLTPIHEGFFMRADR